MSWQLLVAGASCGPRENLGPLQRAGLRMVVYMLLMRPFVRPRSGPMERGVIRGALLCGAIFARALRADATSRHLVRVSSKGDGLGLMEFSQIETLFIKTKLELYRRTQTVHHLRQNDLMTYVQSSSQKYLKFFLIFPRI